MILFIDSLPVESSEVRGDGIPIQGDDGAYARDFFFQLNFETCEQKL